MAVKYLPREQREMMRAMLEAALKAKFPEGSDMPEELRRTLYGVSVPWYNHDQSPRLAAA